MITMNSEPIDRARFSTKMDVFTLDGGLATELERRGYNAENDPLFGSSFLMKDPGAITSVHKAFLENGANIITTATYQANVDILCKYLEVTATTAKALMKTSVRLAQTAIREFHEESDSNGSEPHVAGSVGPYGASLRDGSEYGGGYSISVTEEMLTSWHRPRMQCLIEAGADLIAMETIPSVKEGIALIRLLQEFPMTKAWLSFACKDGTYTCHGDYFTEAVRRCLDQDTARQLVAIGINCSQPEFVSRLLHNARLFRHRIPFVVYPNSGETWTKEKRWSGKDTCRGLEMYVPEWVGLGAKYVGGCCRVTPEDIRKISIEIKKCKETN